MYLIQQITSDAGQKQSLILPDGSIVQISMTFKPMQLGWFMDLVYGEFIVNGMRICVSPNLLYQFKNQIPFGLACFSSASREPSLKEDFQTGAAKLYILDKAEVEEYTEYLVG